MGVGPENLAAPTVVCVYPSGFFDQSASAAPASTFDSNSCVLMVSYQEQAQR